MTKFPMRVRLDKPKLPSQNAAAMRLQAAAKPKPKPTPKPAAKPPAKLKATPAEAAAIERANRAQAREAQFLRTTVRERPSPTRKK
jgi:hypothetical protein